MRLVEVGDPSRITSEGQFARWCAVRQLANRMIRTWGTTCGSMASTDIDSPKADGRAGWR